MQSLYGSLIPTYSASYNALGDQETFVLKYSWELAVYFAFFVFPFINELITDTSFVPAYLSRFSRLGALNNKLQAFISEYYQWKKQNSMISPTEPLFHDYTELAPLRRAEEAFYRVGVSATEAKEVLDDQRNSRITGCFVLAKWHARIGTLHLDAPKAEQMFRVLSKVKRHRRSLTFRLRTQNQESVFRNLRSTRIGHWRSAQGRGKVVGCDLRQSKFSDS